MCDLTVISPLLAAPGDNSATALIVALLTLVLMTLAFSWHQRRKIRQLETLVTERTSELLDVQESLEARVSARTVELQRVNDQLRHNEELYRSVVNGQTEFIVRWNDDGTRTFVNDAYCRYFDVSFEDCIGTSFFPLIAEADREVVRQRLNALSPDHPINSDEHRVVRADGSIGWNVWYDHGIFDESGRLIEVQSVGRDITDRKKIEAEREELIRTLEAQNAELERFTYTVSHDLRSPLITIKGFLGVLSRDLASGSSDRIEHDMQRISEAAESMDRLLSQLLEISRIGRQVNPPSTVALSELAREAADQVLGIGINDVDLDIAPDLPTVECDRVRLLEVFSNLIDNAVRFARPDVRPRIRIGCRQSAETASLDSPADNQSSQDGSASPVIFVEDNGVGIAPQYQEKVFGLFEQLDGDGTGTGIGLAIVRRVIEVHNGRVWVESEGTGHGATFCFTLGGITSGEITSGG